MLPDPASLILQPADHALDVTPLTGSGPRGSYRGSDFRTACAPIPASRPEPADDAEKLRRGGGVVAADHRGIERLDKAGGVVREGVAQVGRGLQIVVEAAKRIQGELTARRAQSAYGESNRQIGHRTIVILAGQSPDALATL